MKYLNLLEVQDLNSEDYKILKKSKENLNKWKATHIHKSEDLTVLRWQYSVGWSTNITQYQSGFYLASL